MVRFARAGARVHLCIITNGSSGSKDPDMTREKLAHVRRLEQEQAAEVLGVHELSWLGYEDGYLEPTIDLRREITRLIRRVAPDVVITHDPSRWYVGDRYINHPDHRAAGEATFGAFMPSSDSRLVFPELEAEGLGVGKPRSLWLTHATEPDHWVDIGDTLDAKIDALRKHVSQVGADFDGVFVRERAYELGRSAGLAAAEVFKTFWFA